MTHSNQDSDSEQPTLDQIILLCQQSHSEWSAAPANEHATARAQYRANLEQLWVAIADDLRLVARGWMRSNMAPDTESLALNMFAHLVMSLPNLKIDPARNVRKFLITVARRRMIDDYRRSYAAPGRRSPKTDDQPLDPGAPGARMWQTERDAEDAAASSQLDAGIADEASYTAEEQLAARIDHQALLAAIWSYWPKSLSAEDLRIVRMRWATEPPCSFREIARRLGGVWAEDAVRQRHHRILKATRDYLRSCGLLDESEA
jgi:DNA-directed RNA polymerase specialized sigma24 family protein